MTHRLRFAARSDRGLLRQNNQDSVYAGDRLLIVADGMGGHAAGDLASRVVVAAFTPLDAEPPLADLLTILRRAMLEGNNAIAEMVEQDPDLDGMGTTCTAMLFDGDRVALAHIGDSRAYLYRNGVLHQLSHDDTFVQSLVDDGRITEEEAAHHPQRNLLLRALNGTAPDPMLSIREISTGDRFLICSDGLSSVVAADAIAETLADVDPDSAADRLIELALVAGGPDNVTVIVADVADIGARASSPTPAGPVDPEATGPLRPIHETQRMPRVPLPAIPDHPRAGAGYRRRPGTSNNSADGTPGSDLDDTDFDDEDFDADFDADFDDDFDDEERDQDGRYRRDGYPADEDADRHPAITPVDLRRRRRRALLIAGAVLVTLALITTGATVWTQSHYFVGVSNGKVVVFRGVQGSFLGISLASVAEDSCATAAPGCQPMEVDDLEQTARDLVIAGIPASDLQQARDTMATLSGRLLPYCDELGLSTSGSTTPTSSTSTSGTPTADTPTSGTPISTAGSSRTAAGTPAAPKTTPPKTTSKTGPAKTTPKVATPKTATPTTKKPAGPGKVTHPGGNKLRGAAAVSDPVGSLSTGLAGTPASDQNSVQPGSVDSMFDTAPTDCRQRR